VITSTDESPKCWTSYHHLLWKVDGFNTNSCGDDDISPCTASLPVIPQYVALLDVEPYRYVRLLAWHREFESTIRISFGVRGANLKGDEIPFIGPLPSTIEMYINHRFNSFVFGKS